MSKLLKNALIITQRRQKMNNKEVDINELKARKDNPRKGNVEKIKQSLKENGQYRPIVVNARNNEILAGNHTWLAARELGWQTIAAWFIDVDEAKAKKIVLADNRTSDVAGYDEELLLEVLQDLDGDLKGTGFEIDDMEDLLSSVGNIDTEYEKFQGGYAETAEETAERYEHRESASEKNEEKRKRVKEVVLVFPEENFDDFVQDVFDLKTKWQLGSTSEIVAKAIREALQK